MALTSVAAACGGVASARTAPPADPWTLDIIDPDGDVAATITAITLQTGSGTVRATDLAATAAERI